MQLELHPDFAAVVLIPEEGDDPADLEDRIHDVVAAGKKGRPKGEKSAVRNVVLELSGLADFKPWVKAAGPQQPDVNVRIVVSDKAFAVARTLGLTAMLEIYPSVPAALNQGV